MNALEILSNAKLNARQKKAVVIDLDIDFIRLQHLTIKPEGKRTIPFLTIAELWTRIGVLEGTHWTIVNELTGKTISGKGVPYGWDAEDVEALAREIVPARL